MKVGIRFGHVPNSADDGAYGIIKETDANRAYGQCVIDYLQKAGHEVVNCTPQSCVSLGDSLTQGVNMANNENVDVFISCHVNAGGGTGCETIYLNGSIRSQEYAQRIVNAMVGIGYPVHGGAYADIRGLYEPKATRMPCVIVEPFFCDTQADVDRFNPQQLGKAIAEGIINQTIEAEVKDMFTDTKGHWAEQQIELLVQKGILHGYENGTFKPDNAITRAELATALENAIRFITGKD